MAYTVVVDKHTCEMQLYTGFLLCFSHYETGLRCCCCWSCSCGCSVMTMMVTTIAVMTTTMVMAMMTITNSISAEVPAICMNVSNVANAHYDEYCGKLFVTAPGRCA